jgi:acetyltransferase-like isoleucine patch superfamily enzyme
MLRFPYLSRVNLIINTIGRFLYFLQRIEKAYATRAKRDGFARVAALDDTTVIKQTGNILNYQKDRSKISIGFKTMFAGEIMLFRHGGEVHIGDHCFIGEGTRIWSAAKITIGNNVLIAHNVNIHDQSSHPLDSRERHEDYKKIFDHGHQPDMKINAVEIVINDDVWIGFNSTILKGVTLGKGAIVGANTVITEDVPDYAVIVGNPARIIKQTT